MSRALRQLCVLCAVLVLAGCSVKMAYNNLDRLTRWSVSDYVDMDDSQRRYFEAAFEGLWFWHRREHLPQYADFFETLGPQLVDGTDEAQMQALVDRIVMWAEQVEDRSLPVAAEMLASLHNDQIDYLAQALEEGNIELAEPEREATAAEIRVLWLEEFEDRFSRFSGRLTSAQRAYLESRAADYVPEAVLWADYRRRWQQDFLALLEYRADVEGLERGLRQLSRHRELYFAPELRAADRSNVALLRETSVWLINSLTDRQQQSLVDALNELAEDFRELARHGDPPSMSRAPCLVRC